MGRRATSENGNLFQEGYSERRGSDLQLQRGSIWVSHNLRKKAKLTMYSHDAQVCYCGEPNCVGFIGGKTQTDIGGMNDLFIDGKLPCLVQASPAPRLGGSFILTPLATALGITDEVELGEMRGTKKKKGRQMDEDFVVSRSRSDGRTTYNTRHSLPFGLSAKRKSPKLLLLCGSRWKILT